jgi:hypothetical protein
MLEPSDWEEGRTFSAFPTFLAWRVSRVDSSDDESEEEEDEPEPEYQSSNPRLGILQTR